MNRYFLKLSNLRHHRLARESVQVRGFENPPSLYRWALGAIRRFSRRWMENSCQAASHWLWGSVTRSFRCWSELIFWSAHLGLLGCRRFQYDYRLYNRYTVIFSILRYLFKLLKIILGYGQIVPVTWIGRLGTIGYSLFGIPLFLVLLAESGLLLTRTVKFYWVYWVRFRATKSGQRVASSRLIRV